MRDKHRAKFVSVVLQPKTATPEIWLDLTDDDEIVDKLQELEFPTPDEITEALKSATATSVNGDIKKMATQWAFGTETSEKTKIPHYQIYLEFPVLIKVSSVRDYFEEHLQYKAHVATEKVFDRGYMNYCLKTTSNFNFEDPIYVNLKLSSRAVEDQVNKLIELRPKLMDIKDNYFRGQELLKTIALGEPDDRTGIWLADVIGGTGKTAFFQTIVTDRELNGLYLRVSEGVERLSAKLRRKIRARLDEGRGYPKFIWINFGRTVEETALKSFSDFSEQILDGMLDDNFGNTADSEFLAMPYVNLLVTANTPPNMLQLTSDRLKILTLFPIYKEGPTFELVDSLLVPIYVETRVRIQKKYHNLLEYKFRIRVEKPEYVEKNYSQFPWYEELLENVLAYEEFVESEGYVQQRYKSKLESEWVSSSPSQVQADIHRVYTKALHAATTIEGRESCYFEASSFRSGIDGNTIDDRVDYYEPKIRLNFRGHSSDSPPGGSEPLGEFSKLYGKIPD